MFGRINLLLILIITSIISFSSIESALAQNSPQQNPAKLKSVPGEYIIKFKPEKASTQKVQSKIFGKASMKAAFGQQRLFHIKLNKVDDSDAVNALSSDPDIEYIEPNYLYDKLAYTQSYAPVMVDQAWNIETPLSNSSPKVVVAVVDTGLDSSHLVFRSISQSGASALWVNNGEIPDNGVDDDHNGYIDDVNGWNFISNNNNFLDQDGHGTHVSGIVVGVGIDIYANPLQESKIAIMPLKFIGTGGSTTSLAIAAINYAVNNGAKVINNSWGGSSYSRSLHDAFAYAYSNGVVLVNAAGNSSSNNSTYPLYPANLDVPSSITVAASDNYDEIAYFSNFSTNFVHLAAPGRSILSSWLYSTNKTLSGTSMAAPFVSGLVALMRREAPYISGYQARQLLLGSVDQLPSLVGKVATGGRANALSAIQSAQSSSSVSAFQPEYKLYYYDGSASLSSTSSGAKSGGGCGLISSIAGSAGLGGGSGLGSGGADMRMTLPSATTIFLVTLPLIIWMILYQHATGAYRRRKYERFNLTSEIKIKFGDKELIGQTRTVSMGGLSFNVDEALSKGGIVKMQISSPDGSGNLIEVEGHIVWSEANQSYGVQFTQLTDALISLAKKPIPDSI